MRPEPGASFCAALPSGHLNPASWRPLGETRVIGQTFIRGSAFDAGQRYGVHPDSAILIGRSRNAQISGNTVARGRVTKAAVAVDRTCDMASVRVENNKLT